MRSKIKELFKDIRASAAVKIKEAKDEGKKVVGVYCLFSPVELIWAGGAIPVGLCGTRQDPIPAAEEVLPTNLCPLIKSSYGFAITDSCPFFYFSDCIIAETTCDGKKKMYELLGRIKPMHVMDLPQRPDTPQALIHWIKEVRNVRDFLEQQLDTPIADEKLRTAIKFTNKQRTLLKEIYDYSKKNPPPFTGMEMNAVVDGVSFQVNQEEYMEKLERRDV
jgi:benzoyl-CoA reductase/2-hydroxyglutaryl-CoA dehydratase subunit BcrC/BadD/HgdB